MKGNERKPVSIYNVLLSLVYKLTVDNHFSRFFTKLLKKYTQTEMLNVLCKNKNRYYLTRDTYS